MIEFLIQLQKVVPHWSRDPSVIYYRERNDLADLDYVSQVFRSQRAHMSTRAFHTSNLEMVVI